MISDKQKRWIIEHCNIENFEEALKLKCFSPSIHKFNQIKYDNSMEYYHYYISLLTAAKEDGYGAK